MAERGSGKDSTSRVGRLAVGVSEYREVVEQAFIDGTIHKMPPFMRDPLSLYSSRGTNVRSHPSDETLSLPLLAAPVRLGLSPTYLRDVDNWLQ